MFSILRRALSTKYTHPSQITDVAKYLKEPLKKTHRRSLKPHSLLSEEILRKINRLAEEYDYRFSLVARKLKESSGISLTHSTVTAAWRRSNSDFGRSERWSPDEDKLLLSLKEEYGFVPWAVIAARMKGRDSFKCSYRCEYLKLCKEKRNSLTKDETNLLVKLVSDFGYTWRAFHKTFFKDVSAQYLRVHYFNNTNAIKATSPENLKINGQFTKEEDELLMQALKDKKSSSAELRELFPGRSFVNIHRRIRVLKKSAQGANRVIYPYSKEEDALITQAIKNRKCTPGELLKLLPERSARSLGHRRDLIKKRLSQENQGLEDSKPTDIPNNPKIARSKKY